MASLLSHSSLLLNLASPRRHLHCHLDSFNRIAYRRLYHQKSEPGTQDVYWDSF